MSTSSSSTIEEDIRQPIALQDFCSEALTANPTALKSNPHGRHASWADHKFTSDGDILTLDSPRQSGDRNSFMEGHVRSLSGQLFGMNLSPDNSVTYSPDQETPDFSDLEHRETSLHSAKDSSFNSNTSIYPTQKASGNVGRKHRRGCSEGKTNPVVAHRRMDSGGNVAFINRHVEHTQHLPLTGQHETSSYRYHNHSTPLQHQTSREHERKTSPIYDQGQRYGHAQASSHRPSQSSQNRSMSYQSRMSHHYSSPRQDTYDYYREDELYRRSYPLGVPPRYQSNRGGYPVYGVVEPGLSQHRYPSPHNSSFPGEVGSRTTNNTGNYVSSNRCYSQSHPSQRDDNPYYLPPRGGQYPVQYANDGSERRYASLPQHPLADNGTYSPYSLPHYRRQTSHNSLGTGSDGRIETDENLFSEESRAIMSSSPRKSPQLFDLALHGKPIPNHISSSPPEFIHYSGGLSEDARTYQGSNVPPLPPGENRIRTASSDSNIKQFMNAVEISHKRGESTDSFIFNESLFGENILEPKPIESHVIDEVDRVDSLAPIPVSKHEAISSIPPVASICIPPSKYYEFNQYNAHPDIIHNHSMSPPYGTHGKMSKSSSFPQLESAASKAHSTSSNSTTMESTDSKTAGWQITGKVSKRSRRKCSIENCHNRVVQGGLCISHGAKRKLCGHPGCNKHVKKAGMCSAHGPSRKLCEFAGCSKVAVQAGRCISHGAKKKLCSVENCKKQAILGGMCKKHHDEEMGREHLFCEPLYGEEMNASTSDYAESPEPPNKPTHARGLSIFTDIDIQEKIIKREINL